MTENNYQIIFKDEQTGHQYQVNICVEGILRKTKVQRNTGWLIGGGSFEDEDIEVNKLEKKLVEQPVPVKL